MTRYKTGETAPKSGLYKYDGPATDGISCVPTGEEQAIPYQRGRLSRQLDHATLRPLGSF